MLALRKIVIPLLFSVATVATSTGPTISKHVNAIRNVLAQYAIEVDAENFVGLSDIFVEDATANYTVGTAKQLFQGIPAIQAYLTASLADVDHHHSMTTQHIEVDENSALATTYFQVTFFGKGNHTGSYAQSFGKYVDELAPAENGKWKIVARDQIPVGSIIGDPTIFL